MKIEKIYLTKDNLTKIKNIDDLGKKEFSNSSFFVII